MEALEILSELLTNVRILYPNEQTQLIFYELLKKYKPLGLRIHDYEIASISLANGINKIATENRSDFRNIEEVSILD